MAFYLSETDKIYLKNYSITFLKCVVLVFIILFCCFSCDLDFVIKEKFLKNDITNYEEHIQITPLNQKQEIQFSGFTLQSSEFLNLTGTVLGFNRDPLRSTCPFQQERKNLYNDYFYGAVISINNEQHGYSFLPKNRIIKQLIKKLAKDEDYLMEHISRKITIEGFKINVEKYKDLNMEHIFITKVILDNKVYQ